MIDSNKRQVQPFLAGNSIPTAGQRAIVVVLTVLHYYSDSADPDKQIATVH